MKIKKMNCLFAVLLLAFCCSSPYAGGQTPSVDGHAKAQKMKVGKKKCPATEQVTNTVDGNCTAAVCQNAANGAQVTLQARLNNTHPGCQAIVVRQCQCSNDPNGRSNVTF